MLQIILAILYTSLLCFSWGFTGLSFIRKWSGDSYAPGFPITCLLGLSLIGITCQLLSVFIPMGGWLVQLFILWPIIYIGVRYPDKLYGLLITWKGYLNSLNKPAILYLCAGLLFILVIGAWHVSNPDTLGYHAPIITWNEQYKVTPGIANLNGRLGLQSSWFILCAVFSFSFTGTPALTFINSTILCWLVLFLADILSRSYQTATTNSKPFILWCVLCVFCFGINIQAYLAASSASPDFIICIFLWACFYLLLEKSDNPQPITQIITALFILAFSVSLKLSAIPALLLLPLIFIRLKSLKTIHRVLITVLVPALAILPFLYRNFISSGYPFFPALYFNYFDVNWKADQTMTRQIDEYVTVYAKVGNVTIDDYVKAATLSFSEWFPIWFGQYTAAEIILTFSALLAALLNIFFAKYYFNKKNQDLGWIIGICVASSLVLMIKAPAPRFSQAFLVPPILAAVYMLLDNYPRLHPALWLRQCVLVLLLLTITGYSAFRFYRYFDLINMWRPYGISASPLKAIECQGMQIYLPLDPSGCGNAPVPCANNACETFLPRGTTIAEGFRAR